MKLFSHSSIILPVPNVKEASEYYRDVLGFSISFLWQDPPTYGVVNREDSVGLHFSESSAPLYTDHAKLYIFVNNPDTVFEEYEKSGATIIEPINDSDYKMREFVIEDLNGYKIVIGKGIQYDH
ncbi:VOC family protein [Ekhidna sp.]|uniref:VOC family protein n=1 Tax=Ekhidna sp. TaxID=2608089 RepID=UPI003B508C5F